MARCSDNLIIFRCIQLLKVVWMEELGQDMLPNGNEEEKWQRKQYSGYWYPCHAKAHQQIHNLEDGERSNLLEGNQFHEGSMNTFKNPIMFFKKK